MLTVLGAADSGVLSLLAASFCVLPIGLTVVGLGGTWLAVLGPLVFWRGPILLGAGLVIAMAWLVILHRRRNGSLQGMRSRPVVATSLTTLSILLAVSAPLWERSVSRALLNNYFDSPIMETSQ